MGRMSGFELLLISDNQRVICTTRGAQESGETQTLIFMIQEEYICGLDVVSHTL